MVTNDYRDWALEQLQRATRASITHRSMFGGVGVYGDGLFFGLMDNDTLYFKVDDGSRAAFEDRGMGPFLPYGDPDRPMAYYQVPPELLETPDELESWIDTALDVARSKKGRAGR